MGRRLEIGHLPEREEMKPAKVEGIMNNGIDNAYPTRMERIIEGSVTAKASADMLMRFIVGEGFKNPELNDIVVGYENYRPVTAYKLLNRIAKSISRHNGFYVWGQFNEALETTGFKPLNYGDCRLSKQDDVNYSGKIVIYNNWDRSISSRIEKKLFKLRHVWNPDPRVIADQIRKADGIDNYKGQVFFDFMETDYVYPLSPVDVVQFDADSEDQVSKFKNGELRKGFFLKYIMHHAEFDTDEDAKDFMKKMAMFNGGDHEVSMLLLEGVFDKDTGEFIRDQNIKIEPLQQNINDKLFDTYQKSWSNNIRKAFDAIPQVLIDYEVSQLGSTSGEAIRSAADYYNTQTSYRRAFIEEAFRNMFKNWKDPKIKGQSFEIEQLKFVKNGTLEQSGTASN